MKVCALPMRYSGRSKHKAKDIVGNDLRERKASDERTTISQFRPRKSTKKKLLFLVQNGMARTEQ
jgi:hypothetical protein